MNTNEKTKEQQKQKLKLKKGPLFALCGSLLILLVILVAVGISRSRVSLVMNGEETVKVEVGQDYQDAGAQGYFKKDEPLTVTVDGSVDAQKIGTYHIKYKTKHGMVTKKATRKVIVQDTTAPEIELVSNPDTYTLPGAAYEEEGYKATDNYDGDLTDKVEKSQQGNVILYTVKDSHGNTATATREINYKDPVPPEITLAGKDSINLRVDDAYTEPGFTASDNVDGDLTAKVKVSGEVDVSKLGNYTIEYSVTDSYENTTTVTRHVRVLPNKQADNLDSGKKIVYLTFDDGPGPYTRQLLDVLDKYNVKVTFFTVNNPDFNDLLADEAAAGHTVAIHSATHDYAKIYSSVDAYMADLHEMESVICSYTGKKPTLIRFPGGSSNTISRNYCDGIMSQLVSKVEDAGFQYFDWNVSSGDAGETKSTDQVVSNVISGIQHNNVSVVLQHDIKGFSVDAVERIIEWGLSNGYTFLPLDEGSKPVHHGVNN